MESLSECSQCISMLILCNYCVFCYLSLISESHVLKVVEINRMETLGARTESLNQISAQEIVNSIAANLPDCISCHSPVPAGLYAAV